MGQAESRVVSGVLQALNALGFLVVWAGGRTKPLPWGYVLRILRSNPRCPGMVWRQNVGARRIEEPGRERFVRFGMAGLADISGIMRGGRVLAIECKTNEGRLSPQQRDYLEAIRELGGVGLMIRDPAQVLALAEYLGSTARIA